MWQKSVGNGLNAVPYIEERFLQLPLGTAGL
jgi:hypothetical protein